jgi:hypothetical protein
MIEQRKVGDAGSSACGSKDVRKEKECSERWVLFLTFCILDGVLALVGFAGSQFQWHHITPIFHTSKWPS